LGFLGFSLFRRETPVFRAWISLDFLGFSRPNRYLSMGYTGKPLKDFFEALSSVAFDAPNGSMRSRLCERADLFMERVYSNFCFSAIDCLLLSLWLLGAGDRGKEASWPGLSHGCPRSAA
jgi:hypothetical protein